MPGPAGPQRRTLGVLVDELSNDYTMALVRALHDAASARDINVIYFTGGDFMSSDVRLRQRNIGFSLASSESVEGLLVLQIGSHVDPEMLAQLIDRLRLPACTIGVRCPGYPCVRLDNDSATRKLVSHVIEEHGRRRILFLRAPAENREVERRYEVYRETLERFGIPFSPTRVVESEFPAEAAQQAMARRLASGPIDFDAVLAATDHMALGALGALSAAGVRVPEDVALMGVDDIEEAWSSIPSLTTVRQPWLEQAEVAIDAVLAQLAGQRVTETRVVHAELVTRRSCGCFERYVAEAGDASRLSPVQGSLERRLAASLDSALAPLGERAPQGAERELVEALRLDLTDGGTRFAAGLERLARDLAAVGHNVRSLQGLLTELRGELLIELEASAERRARAEQLFQQARVVAARAAERQEANRRLDSERLTGILADAARALITSFDVESLPLTLGNLLPRLGIGAAYLLLYVGQGDPPKHCRLAFGYDAARVGPLDHGFKVSTKQLVPEAWLPRKRRYSLVLTPLYFEQDQLGFALFEWGPRNGAVYEALRELLSAALKGARLVRDLAEEAAQREKAERDRLAKELEIAARIQTSILPRDLDVPGLEVAAAMRPATEVGGDYYDVLPTDDGAWLGIGDVAGHGLRPGLVMMMLQSIVATVTTHAPDADPADIVCVVNRVLYENVRRRLGQDEHATLSVLRYKRSGHVTLAGAHEDILVFREQSGCVQTVETPGTWVAATEEIRSVTPTTELTLHAGDVMLLYTDGVIEADDGHGARYGVERLRRLLAKLGHEPIEAIVKALLEDVRRFVAVQHDDIALLAVRHIG